MTTIAKKNATRAMLTALEAQNAQASDINAKLIGAMGVLYASLSLMFFI